METILIARDRKTGKDVLLAGRDVPYPVQNEKYRTFANPVNDEYESVRLVYVPDCKKPLKFITQAEAERRAKAANEAKTLKAETPATAPKSQGKKSKV